MIHQVAIFSRRSAATGFLFCLVFCFAQVAVSDTFSERFRKFVLGPDAAALERSKGSMQPDLDEVAAGCMCCHDGTKATQVSVKGPSQGMQFRGARSINHPVGMIYSEKAHKQPHGFKPIHGLGSQIRLVQGKVSCVSCHLLKEGQPPAALKNNPEKSSMNGCTASKKLASGPKGQNLCQACHIK
jgi:hypothetical protein